MVAIIEGEVLFKQHAGGVLDSLAASHVKTKYPTSHFTSQTRDPMNNRGRRIIDLYFFIHNPKDKFNMDNSKRRPISIPDLLNPITDEPLQSTSVRTLRKTTQVPNTCQRQVPRQVSPKLCTTSEATPELVEDNEHNGDNEDNEDNEDDEDDGYTEEEVAEAVFTFWRLRQHAKLRYKSPDQRPSLRDTRYRGPEKNNRAGVPRADRSKPGHYLPITRETQPDAFEPDPRAAEEAYRKAAEDVKLSEEKVERIRSERRHCGLARSALDDLDRIDSQLEHLQRMMAALQLAEAPVNPHAQNGGYDGARAQIRDSATGSDQ